MSVDYGDGPVYLEYEYARFCDDYGLKRIDATIDEHIRNLNVMKAELDKLQQSYIDTKKEQMLKPSSSPSDSLLNMWTCPTCYCRNLEKYDTCQNCGEIEKMLKSNKGVHLDIGDTTGWDREEAKADLQKIKESNPKDSVGIKKVSMSYIPAPVLAELALAMMEGGFKYGRHNYRVIGVRASVYYDATMRHLMQYWEGEDIDPDSQLCHLTKAIASLTVWRDAMMQGKYVDDRPPKHADQAWVKDMNKHVEKLTEMYPNQKAPYTETPT